jgi:integrase/recombinase XerD
MTKPNKDPRRRCKPVVEWPPEDRAAWEEALRSADPFEDPGRAAQWKPKSRTTIRKSYGRYLTFLEFRGWLKPNEALAERVTQERLAAYVDELRTQVGSVTVAGRIKDLHEAMRVMAPGTDFEFLRLGRYRLKARARPSRHKRSRIVPSQKLLQLGLDLIHQAETVKFSRPSEQACSYRDGLMILILTCRPIRRDTFATLRLGRHLVRAGDIYRLELDGTETKNWRDYGTSLDARLTPFIDRYLKHYRPVLLKDLKSDRVWISMGGHEMAEGSLYQIVTKRTKDEFGWSLSPHLFRDCAVTSLGAENPELVWVGMSLLHHTDPRTTEKHYDQALSDKAVNDYQDVVLRKRRGLTRQHAKRQSKPLSKRSA